MMMMAGCAVFPFLIWYGVRIFFPKPLVKIFFLTYNSVRFFPALYAMKGIFFSVGLFCQVFPCKNFFHRNQCVGYFF